MNQLKLPGNEAFVTKNILFTDSQFSQGHHFKYWFMVPICRTHRNTKFSMSTNEKIINWFLLFLNHIKI